MYLLIFFSEMTPEQHNALLKQLLGKNFKPQSEVCGRIEINDV